MNALVQHHRRSFAILIVSCLCAFASSAQLSANFTATPQSGCSPLVVYFSDQSTGNPTQWKWDLGNGVVSTLKDPSATYFNPGTYTVKLIVKNAAGADSIAKQQYITVYGKPTAAFSVSDSTGCFPLSVRFRDESLAGSGQVADWQWDFGDGNMSSQQNPSHVYTAAGSYSVTLKVTNSFGCTQTITKPQQIRVANGVKADFTYTSSGTCTAPANIQFNNTSGGPAGTSYAWNFGDGGNSTAANPAHTYTANGSYTVQLVAISPQGCRDTLTKNGLFNIGTNHSAFDVPGVLCVNAGAEFKNTSTPMPSSATWYFSDGSSLSGVDVQKAFAAPGNYTVKLVNNFGSCKDSVTHNVTVLAKPKSDFTALGSTIFCKLPATVQFQSNSVGAVQYLWFFGDGATSTETNPSHTYTREGDFYVMLVITNAAGCSDTLRKEDLVQIHEPKIELLGLPAGGCTPLTVSPKANVISNQPIQTYLWNFGDGFTSTAVEPTHTYTTGGSYAVTLTVTTASGCTATVTMDSAVRLGNKPKANFSAQPEVCSSNPAHMTDLSTGDVDQWLWIYGDGKKDTIQNPSHVFNNIRWFSVTLIVYNNGCSDTLKKENAVHVLPPLSIFSIGRNCNDKYTRIFHNGSVQAQRCEWSFGDGTTSTDYSPTHTYAAPGIYRVSLTVYNGNCSHTSIYDELIIDEKPKIVADTVVCKNSTLALTVPNVNPDNIKKWHWSFGDFGSADRPMYVEHVYDNNGLYPVVLTLTDSNNCELHDTLNIRVVGPKAAFTTSVDAACLPGNSIQFNNKSESDNSGSLQTIWNYGDGQIDSTSTAPFFHHFQDTGHYVISLKVRDAHGCMDSAVKDPGVVIAQPYARFTASDTVSCTGKNIDFLNASAGIAPQYQWSFGDGGKSQATEPSHSYLATGKYSVKLVVTDQYGCRDSLTRPNYIDISLPKARFTVSDSLGNCPPLTVNFTNTSSGYVSLKWDFGDGNQSTLLNPSHIYNLAGVFYAKLIATGPGGCTDTAVQKIVIKGPSGSFTYSPTFGCNPLTVSFSATTQNTSSFVWDFSDGNTLSSNTKDPLHTYTVAGDYIPKIILTDATGCHVPIFGKDTIHVYEVKASFRMNATNFCDKARVDFTNTSVSNDLISGYQWKFGDGGSSTETNPSHHYAQPGNYTVRLIAFTRNGCRDTVVMSDTIRILPKPVIQLNSDLQACIPASINVSVQNTGVVPISSWQWDFGNGQTALGQHPVKPVYNQAGNYTITAIGIGNNGCRDTAAKNITIHALPDVDAGKAAEICRGANIQLQATGADSYSWNAVSLSCSNCASPVASPSFSRTYVVTGKNAFGCIKQDSVKITVHQPFKMQVSPSDTICVGSSVRLEASGADLYTWSPSGGMRDADKAIATASPSASTTFTVVGKDKYGCFADTGSVFVKVWSIPTVDAGADQTLVVGQALQLTTTTSPDVTSWLWANAGGLSCATCSTTLAKPKQTTTYVVKVTNDGGCSSTDQVTVNVICNNGNLFVPNTFSPNGDGVNDRFYPSGTGINRIKVLQVFNRWGEVVFERKDFNANDASAGWDGKFKGAALSPDVYIWSCEVICQNNETLSFKGDLTLLK